MAKDEILKKIKETALLLGGKSPSIGDMEKYAKIPSHKWKGKYWTRWSDALAEAGFAANTFSSPAFGKEHILKEILIYARSLNKIPTYTELKIRKQTDSNFPSVTTIKNTFQNIEYSEIKKDLYNYCNNNSEYSDLLALFNEADKAPSLKPSVSESNKISSGYVYLFQHGSRNEYKIGKTNNIIRREGEISIELPEKARPIHHIETDDPSGIEKYWHHRFKDKRKNGEWFELSNADVKAFMRWKNIY
ncbi:T5orf172 domain protein [Leptospira broomii serovar Hurstbridge str. 5399]|uniref:T5orf172 domain protein n=1 Tax=Leptospira broomii serovar Hurstbridge str. 5399 TaxID=1049789 RepID=T0GIK7_9LEPT|nr:GIY-YIG nuclease family protein [Leptospira broomii]EQA46654.1 T5orf172 domain protein [Leptospira broomii serovar Hurstbridge str. 5399]